MLDIESAEPPQLEKHKTLKAEASTGIDHSELQIEQQATEVSKAINHIKTKKLKTGKTKELHKKLSTEQAPAP